MVPPPRRGEVVRQIGEALRAQKADLGLLVTLETGKIRTEGEGEVQEMIDMCDFAVGLSRQLLRPDDRQRAAPAPDDRAVAPAGADRDHHGVQFPGRRLGLERHDRRGLRRHDDLEALAAHAACRPSPFSTSSTDVAEANGCAGVFNLCVGGADDMGERMSHDQRLPLISATGSCRMGRRVGEVVGKRLGRTILELGGNNAIIVAPSADLELAIRATAFAAVGTAGQRCTTVRRLIVHESIHDAVLDRLVHAYRRVPIGEPWDDDVLMGPLISERAVESMMAALEAAREQGGEIVHGGGRLDRPGFFVEPTIVKARPDMPIVGEETFAPILYVMKYQTLDEAIAIQNAVEQGLTSAIFTNDLREAE